MCKGNDCCPCSKACPPPFDINARPKNGVLTTNKVIAKQCVNTPYICGPQGLVNVAGVVFGGDEIKLNAGLVIGEKSCFTNGLVLQTNDNIIAGTWNVLDLITSPLELLSGSTTNNCLYIGADEEFVGFCYDPNNNVAGLSGVSSWEYWNGATWEPRLLMASQTVAPHNQYANTPFERVSADPENIRINTVPDWAKLELNGSEKYWLRLCLTADAVGVPEVNNFKLLASHQSVSPQGFTQYFGEAELTRELVFHRNLLESVNAESPSDIDIDLTGTFSIDARDNSFNNTRDDNMGGVFRIPKSTATENKMTVCIAYYPNNAVDGNVEVGIEYLALKQGDIVNGGLMSKTVKIVQPVLAVDVKKLTLFEFELPIDTVKPYEMIAIRFFRDATADNPTDTYAGDIVVTDISAVVKYWK